MVEPTTDNVEENDYASIDDVVYEDIKLQTKTETVPSLTTLTVPQLRVLQVTLLYCFILTGTELVTILQYYEEI